MRRTEFRALKIVCDRSGVPSVTIFCQNAVDAVSYVEDIEVFSLCHTH